jgi:hypothetical protein
MGRPIAIFGLPKESFVKKVLTLRKKLFEGGKLEEAELLTVPHLTILVNTTLDDLVSNAFLSQKIKSLVSAVNPFTLTVSDFEKMENSIIAKFDTSFSRKLVAQMSSVLTGFRPVTTDFIKIARRVTPGYEEEVLEKIKLEFKKDIVIDRICIGGGALRREDIIWTGDLGKK